MRLIIDGMSARVGGGLSYLVNQLAALRRVRPAWEVSVLTAPWNSTLVEARQPLPIVEVALSSVAQRYVYEQVIMPVRFRDADALYCPGNFGPLLPLGPPVVITFQNPNYVGSGRSQAQNAGILRQGKAFLSRASAHNASAVLAISKTLYADLAMDGFDMSKVHLLPSGAPTWSPADLNREPPPWGRGLDRFFVSIANDYPHKRLTDLVSGWSLAYSGSPSQPPALVLVGGISDDRIAALRQCAAQDVQDRLILLGSLEHKADVWWLLKNALAMISTSELESFGLTPPEAGSASCPVVLTDIPAHREVAGDNARYIPVRDIPALAHILTNITERVSCHWEWSTTWDDNAQQLAKVIEGVVERADSSHGVRASLHKTWKRGRWRP